MFSLVPWYYRALAVVALIAAVAGSAYFKGIERCESQQEANELEHRRDNERILALNQRQQADLQSRLDAARKRLRRAKDACLSVPHSAAVKCVLDLRPESEACP